MKSVRRDARQHLSLWQRHDVTFEVRDGSAADPNTVAAARPLHERIASDDDRRSALKRKHLDSRRASSGDLRPRFDPPPVGRDRAVRKHWHIERLTQT